MNLDRLCSGEKSKEKRKKKRESKPVGLGWALKKEGRHRPWKLTSPTVNSLLIFLAFLPRLLLYSSATDLPLQSSFPWWWSQEGGSISDSFGLSVWMLATSLSSSCQCPVRLLGVYESSCVYSGYHEFSAVGPMILGWLLDCHHTQFCSAGRQYAVFSSVWIVPIYSSVDISLSQIIPVDHRIVPECHLPSCWGRKHFHCFESLTQ